MRIRAKNACHGLSSSGDGFIRGTDVAYSLTRRTMKIRTAFELLVFAMAFGCGGNLFSAGNPSDGGPGTSSTGSGDTVGSTTVGTGGAGGSTGTGGAGGGVDWSLCGGPGECTAALTGCCGACGMPQLDNFAGVNRQHLDAFRTATCPMPTPCSACPTAPNPYIGARCTGTHCQAFDLRSTPEYSKCAINSDCRLRKGLDCCECGSAGEWTAVSVAGQQALNGALCVPNTGCDLCLPVPPPGMTAVCWIGHCEVATAIGGNCTVVPRAGCCFTDSQCMGRCYGATCAPGSEGICKSTPPPSGQCWGDADCAGGQLCRGARICPCGAACLLADAPGTCQ
jgi:hypothetical protein